MKIQQFLGYARKFLIALVAAITILGIALSDNTVTQSEWIQVAVAFLGALGVYQVKNDEVAK